VQNGSGIVVITQLMPIDVLFTMPEDNLPAVLKKMHGGGSLKVDVYDRAGQNKLGSGTLASLDNQIDTSTGTVKAKAEFANSDQALFPNQFVNARVLLDVLHGATVIPTSALQQGANGLFVYVVKPDHTVTVRTIKTGPTQGERVAVESGLTVGETIVTEGGDRLREGSKVQLPGEAPPSGGDRAQQERGQERKTDGEAQPDQQGQHRRRGGSDQNDAGKGASPAPGPGSTSPAPAGGKSGGASDGSGG
jgi:multidrug efflux system membrane fusion protein